MDIKTNLKKIVTGVGVGVGLGAGVILTVLPSDSLQAQSTMLHDAGVAKLSKSSKSESDSLNLPRHSPLYKDNYGQTDEEDALIANALSVAKNNTTKRDSIIKEMRFTNITALNLNWESEEEPGDRIQEKYVAYLVHLDKSNTDGSLIFENDLNIKNFSKFSSAKSLENHFNIYTVNTTTKTLGVTGEKIEVTQNNVRKAIKDNYSDICWERDIVEKIKTEAGTEYLIRLVGTAKKTRAYEEGKDPTNEYRIVADWLKGEKSVNTTKTHSDRGIVSIELYGSSDFNESHGGGAAIRLRPGHKSPVAIAVGYNYLQDHLPELFSVVKDVLEPNPQGYVTAHFDKLVTTSTDVNYNGSIGLIVDVSKTVAIATRLDFASFTENESNQTVQRNYWTGTNDLVDPTEDINENPVGPAVNSMSSVPFKPAKVNLGVELKVAKHWAIKAMGGAKLYESNSPATLDVGGVYHF